MQGRLVFLNERLAKGQPHCQREEAIMATMKEIRNAMADDLAQQGWNQAELAEFCDQFDRNTRTRPNSLLTSEVEMTGFYAWCDEQMFGWFLTSIRSAGHDEVRKYYR